MAKKFFITSEEECQRCKGSGLVANPDWTRFYEKRPNFSSYTATEVGVTLFDHFQVSGLGKLPPEVEQCGDCEGEGKFTCRVELAEALAEFGIARESIPRLQFQVSELRHKAGITEVDEEYEQAMASRN
jgi:hypothetical protein